MTKVYLIEISGQTVRAFADEAKAKQYIECLTEEWDEELHEPRYEGYDIGYVEMDLE